MRFPRQSFNVNVNVNINVLRDLPVRRYDDESDFLHFGRRSANMPHYKGYRLDNEVSSFYLMISTFASVL